MDGARGPGVPRIRQRRGAEARGVRASSLGTKGGDEDRIGATTLSDGMRRPRIGWTQGVPRRAPAARGLEALLQPRARAQQ